MLAALLLAACVPLPTCGNPVFPPCASPTPTLRWDRVPDTPEAIVAGYDVYSRAPGGSWEVAAILPCWYEDEGWKRCTGVDIDYPVQRVNSWQLETVEWCVRAYDTNGESSPVCSAAVSICMPPIWTAGHYE